jgi:hypothetical protein
LWDLEVPSLALLELYEFSQQIPPSSDLGQITF